LNVPFFIARRYLFSRKSHNIINIVSGISALGIGVGTLALVVVLSAFNGLEHLVGSLYSNFDPDLKVLPASGKRFTWDTAFLDQIRQEPYVQKATPTLEEVVLLKYRDAQVFVSLKGVYPEFIEITRLDTMMHDGRAVLRDGAVQHLIAGYGVADKLNIFLTHVFEPVKVYAARRDATVNTSPDNAFLTEVVYPSGIFSVNPDFDYKYALAHYDFVSQLLMAPGEASAIELSLAPGVNPDAAAAQLAAKLGSDFTVKTRYRLNEVLYKTNNTEKWVTFLILSFILIIAAFNLIGSVTMLVIDKKRDMFMLMAMGARQNLVRRIFIAEGMLITALGGGGGLILGLVLCLLQQHVGLVRLQEGSIAEFYPVIVKFSDLIFIGGVVALIGLAASLLPARSKFDIGASGQAAL
jgi:lipoprotein-releasing system permease protein